MAHYSATINVDATPDEAFAFLVDPLNRAEWDPSVRSIEPGDDHVTMTVGFYGKAVEATYAVEEAVAPSRIVFATGGKVKGRDVIEIVPREGGSSVTIELDVQLKGAARLLDRGLQVAFAGIGDNVAREMKRRLDA